MRFLSWYVLSCLKKLGLLGGDGMTRRKGAGSCFSGGKRRVEHGDVVYEGSYEVYRSYRAAVVVCGEEDGEGRSGMMKCEAPLRFRVELFFKAWKATHFHSCA
jgi:hypothetical protein